MNIICSPCGIVDSLRTKQGLQDIKNAGYGHVLLDMSMYCTEDELKYVGKKRPQNEVTGYALLSEHPEAMRERLLATITNAQEIGIGIPVAYAPHVQRDLRRGDLSELLCTLAKETIMQAGRIGCKYIIVRPLFAGIERNEQYCSNMTFYKSLAQTAIEQDVMVLLTNTCKDIDGHLVRGLCADGYEAGKWIDELNNYAANELKAESDVFGFYLDTAVCTICGQNVFEVIMELQNRIHAVALRDCSGHDESSLLPFTSIGKHACQSDWLGVIRGLRDIGFDGQLILDMADTAVHFSPLIKPSLLALSYQVADYFRMQIELESMLRKYDHIVLFGAGNMCRNYLKNYGEKYPPLFTCDNNKDKWETDFFGLTIKSPEKLKNLPENTGIVICNVYYREISQQLRDMGIENGIEMFNDEYLPSYFMNRLDRKGE